MPRQPDPDLEERILKAAQMLWKRGGDEALTMRAVARAAGTNTPAVYRRFKDRKDLVRGLLLRTAARTRQGFEAGETVQEMAETYIDMALEDPHEYELFYSHARELSPRQKSREAAKPIRETRPNFALLEQRLAKQAGGSPDEQTRLGLAIWSLMHGTTSLLLLGAVAGHEDEFRSASRIALKALLEKSEEFKRHGADRRKR